MGGDYRNYRSVTDIVIIGEFINVSVRFEFIEMISVYNFLK